MLSCFAFGQSSIQSLGALCCHILIRSSDYQSNGVMQITYLSVLKFIVHLSLLCSVSQGIIFPTFTCKFTYEQVQLMEDIRESLEGGRGGGTRDLSLLLCLGLCLLHWLCFLSGSNVHWTVPPFMVLSHQAASTAVLVPAGWPQLWTLTATPPLIVSSDIGMAVAFLLLLGSGLSHHFLGAPSALLSFVQ